ncbi:MAG: hypothetical protein KKF46_07655 [Nanoarchaeota archaeon]|nr:hypothetical protein [Nanoarchaeota archaeon]MBU1322203.1 hypothetical protein [Nanoarchaeota archaeon]MBU1597744.1 hypothetical protein [Nanoarchaeota archaeon]MBU2442008.1 hypothetical protein [Nanoarchaeota archaeon]
MHGKDKKNLRFGGSLELQKAFRYWKKTETVKDYFRTYGSLMYFGEALKKLENVDLDEKIPNFSQIVAFEAESLLNRVREYRTDIAKNVPGFYENINDSLNELEKICESYVKK